MGGSASVRGMSELRRKIAGSRLAPLAALPIRLKSVARYDAQVLGRSARWLVGSREHTNFTYDLTPLNREHLAWWVAEVADCPVAEARGYMIEIEQDGDLTRHVQAATQASDRRGLADREVRLHKRIGWYALVRALRPEHVIETGTDKGLGSVVLAAALLRNGQGRLTTMDVNSDAGYLISDDYATVTDVLIGDSLTALARMDIPVDFFLHDSLHTREHEIAEYDAVAPWLAERGVVLSDNAHVTDALPVWAEQTGRRFTYFQERPDGHWYPGGGIGLAHQ
jgi:Methyltransferase domain